MNLAFSGAFRIVRNFRGVFPRCQTKNRIKSISLFDLGTSNPCRKMVLPLKLLPSSLDYAGYRDLVRPLEPALICNLREAAGNRVHFEQ